MEYKLKIPKIETREEGAEHLLGSIEKLRGQVLNPSGDWSKYLPIFEAQNRGFETKACAVFSSHNAIETLLKFKGVEANYSDRYLAIVGNVDPKEGSDPHAICECIRKTSGCLDEGQLPFSEDIRTLSQFYSPKPMTSELLYKGNEWYNTFGFAHEWIWIGGSPSYKKTQLKDGNIFIFKKLKSTGS